MNASWRGADTRARPIPIWHRGAFEVGLHLLKVLFVV